MRRWYAGPVSSTVDGVDIDWHRISRFCGRIEWAILVGQREPHDCQKQPRSHDAKKQISQPHMVMALTNKLTSHKV